MRSKRQGPTATLAGTSPAVLTVTAAAGTTCPGACPPTLAGLRVLGDTPGRGPRGLGGNMLHRDGGVSGAGPWRGGIRGGALVYQHGALWKQPALGVFSNESVLTVTIYACPCHLLWQPSPPASVARVGQSGRRTAAPDPLVVVNNASSFRTPPHPGQPHGLPTRMRQGAGTLFLLK